MAWITENRRTAKIDRRAEPYLTDDIKQTLETVYFPRYPTKRAVLLPALHAIQHKYNWIPVQAMEELGTFLELAPAEVMDTATFYEEYWLKPKGQYLIQVCRSLSCEVCQSKALTAHCRKKLGIEVGETTPDGKFTLIELECLGACGDAPVALVNEALYENLTPDKIDAVLDQLPADPHDFHDPTMDWEAPGAHEHGFAASGAPSRSPDLREGVDPNSHGGAEGKTMN
ncbi:MAG TPA: NAD(P)H-dependent oxidoreductase subunit E [Tepidisphaeraceae bacterium]|jgi:NADH-quinone oxidoreductase subunit E|nr:NAD(P)H-dependent oxidoreductase subunit E [Tepidisphaeraceae bacterium]